MQALPKKHLLIHFQKMENLRDNNRLSAAGTILVLNGDSSLDTSKDYQEKPWESHPGPEECSLTLCKNPI